MTIGELLEKLKAFPPEWPVRVSVGWAGDHALGDSGSVEVSPDTRPGAQPGVTLTGWRSDTAGVLKFTG